MDLWFRAWAQQTLDFIWKFGKGQERADGSLFASVLRCSDKQVKELQRALCTDKHANESPRFALHAKAAAVITTAVAAGATATPAGAATGAAALTAVWLSYLFNAF